MSNPAHTPGPWVIDRLESASGVIGIDSIGPIYADHDRFSDCAVIVASDANAHLIAAAPDLYAALEDCIGRFVEAFPAAETYAPIVAARAALAKARGEAK